MYTIKFKDGSEQHGIQSWKDRGIVDWELLGTLADPTNHMIEFTNMAGETGYCESRKIEHIRESPDTKKITRSEVGLKTGHVIYTTVEPRTLLNEATSYNWIKDINDESWWFPQEQIAYIKEIKL